MKASELLAAISALDGYGLTVTDEELLRASIIKETDAENDLEACELMEDLPEEAYADQRTDPS